MSADSRSISNGSEKSKGSRFFKRSATGEVTDALKKDISKLGGITRNIGNSIHSAFMNGVGKKDVPEAVYTPGTRSLDSEGYEIYNIPDGMEIFISKVSDTAVFDQDLQIVRATEGNFVGSNVKSVKTQTEQDYGGTFGQADVRSLFSNVTTGDKSGRDIVGSVGTVEDGELVPATPVNKVPSDPQNVFNKMRSSKVEYEMTVLNQDGTIETVPAEGDAADGSIVSETVEDVGTTFGAESVIDDVPETVPSVQTDAVSVADVHEETVSGSTQDDHTEVPVIDDVPAQVSAETKRRDEFFIETEVPVEELDGSTDEESEPWNDPDLNLDNLVPDTSDVQPMTATAQIQKMSVDGLVTEGDAETNMAVTNGESISTQECEQALTSSDATPASEHKPLDLEAEKETLSPEPEIPEAPKVTVVEPNAAETVTGTEVVKSKFEDENTLPSMADPVRHRPRYSYRPMKIVNGKVQVVPGKDSGEGVQRIAGQTSPRSAPVERLPPAMPRRPRITIDGDVGSIMRLALPELDLDEDSCTVDNEYAYIPEDGLEAICFAEPPMMEVPVPEFPALAAPVVVPAIAPATDIVCIAKAPEVIAIASAPEAALIPAAEAVPAIGAPADDIVGQVQEVPVVRKGHAVVFSFGGSGTEGSVCFSF